MKKRVLFIGFGLDPERVEAVSKNTFALQQLLTKELNIEAECLPVSERQSDATGLDKQSFLYCLRNRNMIIDQISGYITKHNITHVHDVFVLSAASIIFTLPLKKLHPNVVFIKEVHNAWGFSKHIHSETIIRILFNSRPYSYIIKRDFDVVITRKVLLAKIEKIIFIPPLIQVFKKRLFKFKNRLSFCYLGHPLVKKGVDEFLKLFEIIPDEIKDKIVFNFAFSNIGPKKKIEEMIRKSAEENNINIKIEGIVEPQKFFRKNDVFILPLHDRFGASSTPNTILEAMEAGCLVITTRTEPLYKLATNNQNAFLLPSSEAKHILNRIKYILNNPNKINAMTSMAREKVILYCSREKTIKKLKQIYG